MGGDSAFFESDAWAGIHPGWRRIHGSFPALGVSIEEHDFRAASRIDWARSFHPESLELCLNLAGRGEVTAGGHTMVYDQRTAGHCAIGRERLAAWRSANQRHLFVTVEMSREFLRRHIADGEGLVPGARRFFEGKSTPSGLGEVRPLTGAQEAVVLSLRRPPVADTARGLWFQSKVLELIAQMLFVPPEPEFFCTRQKRVARERVEAAMTILRQQLQAPPSLEQLGRAVGCSPFYLSRTFSEETGMTIPLYVRKLRMERAAELIAGGYGVTQAAFEVGYSSLGHFSKSFCEVIGCCPSLYPQAQSLVKRSARRATGR